jgi:hypothetical protein
MFDKHVSARAILVITAVACATTGAFVARGDSGTATPVDHDSPARSQRSVVAAAPVGSRLPSSAATERIALLRRAQSANDGLGRFTPSGRAAQSFGVDTGQARLARTPDSEWKVWLVSDERVACVFYAQPGSPTAGGGCGPVAEAATRGMGFTHTGAGRDPVVTVVGVVPDGVDRATLVGGAAPQRVDVTDNVFVTTADPDTTAYRFVDGDVERSMPVDVER